jgi:hypothetical protein
MQSTDVLTGREIEEAFDLTPAQRRFWTNGAVFNISPSGSRNLKGVTALFELRDAYLFGLVVAGTRGDPNASFADVGTIVDKIKADPEWDFWQKDRGVLRAASFKGLPKELADATLTGPDGWKIHYIGRTNINNGFLEWTRKRAEILGAAVGNYEVSYQFLLNCPEFPNTPEAIEALMKRMKTSFKTSRGEIAPASTAMSYQFDLEQILDAVDYRWVEQMRKRGTA